MRAMSISFLGGELRRAGQRAVDLLLPPLCLRCDTPVDDIGALCAACWVNIGFIAPPFCACCGYPFEFDPGPDSLCAGCARAQPRFARARAVFRYDDSSRDLVLGGIAVGGFAAAGALDVALAALEAGTLGEHEAAVVAAWAWGGGLHALLLSGPPT